MNELWLLPEPDVPPHTETEWGLTKCLGQTRRETTSRDALGMGRDDLWRGAEGAARGDLCKLIGELYEATRRLKLSILGT